jgi:voltage-gated potassium channel
VRPQIWRVPVALPRRLSIPSRLLLFWSFPIGLIGGGTVGYHAIERWPWFDSLYVAVVTLTSIGYGDRYAVSIAGRVLTLALALGGISTFALAVTELLGLVITGELRDAWGSWRMTKEVSALKEHVIVCGYGQVGRHVCADLKGGGVPVVVIDRQDNALLAARDAGLAIVRGDATTDTTLKEAGLDRARALVVVAGADADAVLITMTARLLCPELAIVARAEEEGTIPKLRRAGATRTASPDAVAGGRLAQAVLCPSVLDVALHLDEELVQAGSPLDGKTVGTSGLRARRGQILVAIKHRDGDVAFNPDDDAPVTAGDTLITLGNRAPLGRYNELAIT